VDAYNEWAKGYDYDTTGAIRTGVLKGNQPAFKDRRSKNPAKMEELNRAVEVAKAARAARAAPPVETPPVIKPFEVEEFLNEPGVSGPQRILRPTGLERDNPARIRGYDAHANVRDIFNAKGDLATTAHATMGNHETHIVRSVGHGPSTAYAARRPMEMFKRTAYKVAQGLDPLNIAEAATRVVGMAKAPETAAVNRINRYPLQENTQTFVEETKSAGAPHFQRLKEIFQGDINLKNAFKTLRDPEALRTAYNQFNADEMNLTVDTVPRAGYRGNDGPGIFPDAPRETSTHLPVPRETARRGLEAGKFLRRQEIQHQVTRAINNNKTFTEYYREQQLHPEDVVRNPVEASDENLAAILEHENTRAVRIQRRDMRDFEGTFKEYVDKKESSASKRSGRVTTHGREVYEQQYRKDWNERYELNDFHIDNVALHARHWEEAFNIADRAESESKGETVAERGSPFTERERADIHRADSDAFNVDHDVLNIEHASTARDSATSTRRGLNGEPQNTRMTETRTPAEIRRFGRLSESEQRNEVNANANQLGAGDAFGEFTSSVLGSLHYSEWGTGIAAGMVGDFAQRAVFGDEGGDGLRQKIGAGAYGVGGRGIVSGGVSGGVQHMMKAGLGAAGVGTRQNLAAQATQGAERLAQRAGQGVTADEMRQGVVAEMTDRLGQEAGEAAAENFLAREGTAAAAGLTGAGIGGLGLAVGGGIVGGIAGGVTKYALKELHAGEGTQDVVSGGVGGLAAAMSGAALFGQEVGATVGLAGGITMPIGWLAGAAVGATMGAIGYGLESTHVFERATDFFSGKDYVGPEEREKRRLAEIAAYEKHRKDAIAAYKARQSANYRLYLRAGGGFHLSAARYGRMYNRIQKMNPYDRQAVARRRGEAILARTRGGSHYGKYVGPRYQPGPDGKGGTKQTRVVSIHDGGPNDPDVSADTSAQTGSKSRGVGESATQAERDRRAAEREINLQRLDEERREIARKVALQKGKEAGFEDYARNRQRELENG
tara:strand:+ start:176 stop:3196 length:3021 start_codon:yes stop_codon:yes gene_type:complete